MPICQQTNLGATRWTEVGGVGGPQVAEVPRGRPPRFSGATLVPERLPIVGATEFAGRGVDRLTLSRFVRVCAFVQPALGSVSPGRTCSTGSTFAAGPGACGPSEVAAIVPVSTGALGDV